MPRSRILLNVEFEYVFKLFHVINTIFLTRFYNVKSNVATPLSKYNFVITALNILCLIGLFYIILSIKLNYISSMKSVTLFSFCFSYGQSALSQILNLFIICWHSANSFALLGSLQEISCSTRSAEDRRRLCYASRVSLFILLLHYVLYSILKVTLDPGGQFWHVIFYIMTSNLELSILNGIIVLYFLTVKMKRWKVGVMRLDYIDVNEFKACFDAIAHSVELFMKIFNGIITIFIIMTFTQSMTYVDIILIWQKSNSPEYNVYFHMVLISIYVFRRLYINIFLCVTIELLYKEVEDIRATILVQYSQLNYSNRISRNQLELKRFYKYILHVIDSRFSKMSACGLFTIDAGLSLRLGMTITTYTLVLLQFEYVKET